MRARQGARRHRPPRGAGDQGRRPRRPAHPGAPGRLRPLLRGRRPPRAARPARDQEPLRLHQRDRPVRDAPGRAWCRSTTPPASTWPRPASGWARASSRRSRAAAPCWSRCRPWWAPPRSSRRAASRSGSTARGWPRSSPSCHVTPGCASATQDVFVSVAGGARALDPAADLAMALAITSAHRGVPLAAGTVAFGELGLTGRGAPVGARGATARRRRRPRHGRRHHASRGGRRRAGITGARARHQAPGVREALEMAFCTMNGEGACQ